MTEERPIERLHRLLEAAERTGDWEQLPPLHPGAVLREEFLVPLGLSTGAAARALGLPRSRVERVTAERIGVSTDTALRLSRWLGTSVQFWQNLQARYEVETAEPRIAADLDRIAPLPAGAGRVSARGRP